MGKDRYIEKKSKGVNRKQNQKTRTLGEVLTQVRVAKAQAERVPLPQARSLASGLKPLSKGLSLEKDPES